MKPIQHFLEYILVRILILGVTPLSQKQATTFGRCLGALVFRFSGKRKKAAFANMDIMFSDSYSPDKKKRVVKSSFEALAVSAIQSVWVTTNTEERVHSLIEGEPKGLDILRKCLEKKKGIFFLTAHYGNWEIMGLFHGKNTK